MFCDENRPRGDEVGYQTQRTRWKSGRDSLHWPEWAEGRDHQPTDDKPMNFSRTCMAWACQVINRSAVWLDSVGT